LHALHLLDLECVDHLLRPLTQPFIAKNYKETETIYASFLPYSSDLLSSSYNSVTSIRVVEVRFFKKKKKKEGFSCEMSDSESNSSASSSSMSSLPSRDSSLSDSSRSVYRRRRRANNELLGRLLEGEEQGFPAQPNGEVLAQPAQPVEPVRAQPGPAHGDIIKFKISSEKSKRLRNLVKFGLSNAKAKVLRNRFSPKFKKDKFGLCIPEMDDSVYSELMVVKRSSLAKEKIDRHEADWRSIQFKVLDVVRPILFIWQSTGDRAIKKAAKAAIRLWAHAHFSLTALRRKNILKQTHPKYLSLLKKDKYFNGQEFDALFGDTFLDMMVKKAKDENALQAAAGRSSGPNSRSDRGNRGGRSTGRGGSAPFSNLGSSSNNPGSSAVVRNGQGFVHQNGSNSRQRYCLPPILSAFTDMSSPIGGRLKNFAGNWPTVSKDPWVLDLVCNGLKIEFMSEPFQARRPATAVLGQKEFEICNKEIASLLKKNAICPSFEPDNLSFLSSFFIIPKKGGDFRPVHNLKALNRFVTYRHFKMESNAMLKHLVRRGDWFVKIDLKDAYLTVPIHPSHQRFLQLQWQGRLYQFTCLPFGLSSAPWAFTKLLKPVVAFLRRRGSRLIIYLDDILVIGADRDKLAQEFVFIKSLLEYLGFIVNMEKSIGTPSQVMEFLGLMVNSLSLSVALPEEKVQSIILLCSEARAGTEVSARDLAVILGKLAWATFAIPFAQAHYRSIQSLYIPYAKRGDMKAKVELTEAAIRDLDWWLNNLVGANGKSLIENDPDLVIFSDASLTGWGGFCNGVRTRGPWPVKDRARHINQLELMAAFHCLRSFANNASRSFIQLQLDNATAVAYINKRGAQGLARCPKLR
jgi:uncharacterized membrane protein YgcG